jgi:hypothetical protein
MQNRANSWSVRLSDENRLHDYATFLTLTYNDENLPENQSLGKRDLQLFLKRLRKALHPTKIRYYACGEYGSHTYRPHYHLIIFGLYCTRPVLYPYPFDSPYSFDKRFSLFAQHSKAVENAWGKGFCHFGSVNSKSISYVVKYVIKTHSYEYRRNVSLRGLQPDFALMSRRPGLGFGFLEYFEKKLGGNYKRLYSYGYRSRYKNVIPRYYDEKIFGKNSEELKRLKGEFLFRENGRLIAKYNELLERKYNESRSRAFGRLMPVFSAPVHQRAFWTNFRYVRCHQFNYEMFLKMYPKFKPFPNIDVLSNLDKFPEIKKIYDEENVGRHAQALSVRRFFDMTILGRNKL